MIFLGIIIEQLVYMKSLRYPSINHVYISCEIFFEPSGAFVLLYLSICCDLNRRNKKKLSKNVKEKELELGAADEIGNRASDCCYFDLNGEEVGAHVKIIVNCDWRTVKV